MKMQLSKSVMMAFYIAQDALKKVLSVDSFEWEQLDLSSENFESPESQTEEEKKEREFSFCGYIKAGDKRYSALVAVRVMRGPSDKWYIKRVDAYCRLPDFGVNLGIKSYTVFEYENGELVKQE